VAEEYGEHPLAILNAMKDFATQHARSFAMLRMTSGRVLRMTIEEEEPLTIGGEDHGG
jgi:hypothetical protein